MKRGKAAILLSITLLILLSIGGCGKAPAPPDATITISPSDVTVNDSSYWGVNTQYFQIVVKDANGIPLKDVELTINFIWANPDKNPNDLDLLYDLNCDGTPETPLVQFYDGDNAKDSPMVVKTDENGSYILRFEFLSGGVDLDCDGAVDVDANGDPVVLAYKGDIEVTSGSVYTSAKFEVKKAAE